MKRLLAVLGSDVSKSLSPLLHTAAAQATGADIAYVPVNCPTVADFDRAVDALRTLGALGANVTIPYKIRALERADRSSPTAEALGAVNTLTFHPDGTIEGDNTDAPGLAAVLSDLSHETTRKIQILGAGGSARAAVWAAQRQRPAAIVVTARSKADALAERFGVEAAPLRPVPEATLVISTLPKDPSLAERALSEWVDVGTEGRPTVCDLAYGSPAEVSALVRLARARGLPAFDGRRMLVEQAALAFQVWTGSNVTRIRNAMLTALPFDSTSRRN